MEGNPAFILGVLSALGVTAYLSHYSLLLVLI